GAGDSSATNVGRVTVTSGAGNDVVMAELERDSFAFENGSSAAAAGQTIRLQFRSTTDAAMNAGAGVDLPVDNPTVSFDASASSAMHDLLHGGAGDDLLIGGDTSYDALNGNLQILDLTTVAIDPAGPAGTVTFHLDHWAVY